MQKVKILGAVFAGVICLAAGTAAGFVISGSSHKSSTTVTQTATLTVARVRTVAALGRRAKRARARQRPHPRKQRAAVNHVSPRHPATPAPAPSTPPPPAPKAGGGSVKLYAGNGTTSLGRIVISSATTLNWTISGGHLQIVFDGDIVGVSSSDRTGSSFVPPGTYNSVKVVTSGRWTIKLG